MSIGPQLQSMMLQVNTIIHTTASQRGHGVTLRFECDDPAHPTVHNVVLPSHGGFDSFNTIVHDLQQLGYSRPLAKYLVWFDGTVDVDGLFIEAAGQASGPLRDNRSGPENRNNFGPGYAVVYQREGDEGVATFLHEIAHVMGAVQPGAPHWTGSDHCSDGQDYVCYLDGTGVYDPFACPTTTFDCHGDDYFHPTPPPGSWLASHWNLASPANGFISWGNTRPTGLDFGCHPDPVRAGAPAECAFFAEDDSPGIAYEVSWGDGQNERLPPTGFAQPGKATIARHAWDVPGSFVIEVVARDDGGAAGDVVTREQSVEICGFHVRGALLFGVPSAIREPEVEGFNARTYPVAEPCIGRVATTSPGVTLRWVSATGALLGEGATVPAGTASVRVLTGAPFSTFSVDIP